MHSRSDRAPARPPRHAAGTVGAVAREHLAVDRAFGMHYDVLPWSRVVDSARPPKYD